jgi:hypothetical protein
VASEKQNSVEFKPCENDWRSPPSCTRLCAYRPLLVKRQSNRYRTCSTCRRSLAKRLSYLASWKFRGKLPVAMGRSPSALAHCDVFHPRRPSSSPNASIKKR